MNKILIILTVFLVSIGFVSGSGEYVESFKLEDGEIIELGSYEFRYSAGSFNQTEVFTFANKTGDTTRIIDQLVEDEIESVLYLQFQGFHLP